MTSQPGIRSRPVWRSALRLVAGMAVSGLFVWLALRGVDVGATTDHLRGLDGSFVWPAAAALLSLFAYKAFRWQYQLAALKSVRLSRSFHALVVGFMANNVLPFRAGDLLRAVVLARSEQMGTTMLFSTVVLERVLDVGSMVAVAMAVLMAIPLPGWMRDGVLLLGFGCIAVVVGATVTGRVAWITRMLHQARQRWLPPAVYQLVSKLEGQVRIGLGTVRGTGRLVNLALLAAAEWLLWGVLAYACLHAVHIDLGPAQVMTVVIATNLAMALPAAPANIGVFEFAVISTLEFFQIDRSLALSGAVVIHTLFVVPISVLGLAMFLADAARHGALGARRGDV